MATRNVTMNLIRAVALTVALAACTRSAPRDSNETGAAESGAASSSTTSGASTSSAAQSGPPQAAASVTATARASVVPAGTTITVYKSPTCGCCGKWEDHMRSAGFTVKSVPTNDLDAVKKTHAIPMNMQSCHTGLVNGYIVEGHAPAADIARMLDEKPDIRGIAVPGMPAGSPGMEGAWRDAYDVVTLPKSGTSTVWSRH